MTIFIVATLISIITIYISKLVAVKVGVVAKVQESRWHRSGNVPKLAGPAILSAIIPWVSWEEWILVLPFCVIGVLDDIYNLRPFTKALFLTIPCTLIGWVVGFWWVGVMCWLVANALNLLDHADGLAGTTAFVALQFAGGAFGIAGSGACLGFLFHNFPPARVFLGDGGSLMLGAMMVLCWAPYGFLSVLLATFVPLAEVMFVTSRRLWEGRRPWIGGTDHSGHILLRRGIPQKILPIIYGSVTAIFCSGIFSE